MIPVPIRKRIQSQIIRKVMNSLTVKCRLVRFPLAIYPNPIIDGAAIEAVQRANPPPAANREAGQEVAREAVRRAHTHGPRHADRDQSKYQQVSYFQKIFSFIFN